jgi:hypothetical protein
VDNCCNVRNILSRCFPGAKDNIKLDAFHWLKRWNDIMDSPASAPAGIYRGLMSRALFNVEPYEFQRAKAHLQQKKRREPTTKEVLRYANSVIPGPNSLRKNVEATFLYEQSCDAEVLRREAIRQQDDNSPKAKRFFISSATKIQQKVQGQLKHTSIVAVCPILPVSTFLGTMRRMMLPMCLVGQTPTNKTIWIWPKMSYQQHILVSSTWRCYRDH